MSAVPPRSVLMASTIGALAVAPTAEAVPSKQWFTGNSIGAGSSYMTEPGTNRGGLAHVLQEQLAPTANPPTWNAYGGDLVYELAANGPNADYCSPYNTGSILNVPYTSGGFTSIMDGPSGTARNVCTVQNRDWLLQNTAGGSNGSCVSLVPCGMHHFASNAAQSAGAKPWDPATFGDFPSLLVDVNVLYANVDGGGGGTWGYVCPHFRDEKATLGPNHDKHMVIEYCLGEWVSGTGYPAFGVVDVKSDCAGAAGTEFAHMTTDFSTITRYATMRVGSDFTRTTPVAGHFVATISRADFERAIAHVKRAADPTNPQAGCNANGDLNGISDSASNWEYLGVEQGIEGGGGGLNGFSTGNRINQIATVTDTLYAGQRLTSGQRITSPNGQYYATLASDGDFAVFGPGDVKVWSAGTYGYSYQSGKNTVTVNPGTEVDMQPDGNLVVYASGKNGLEVRCQTHTAGSNANYLIVQDNGDLGLYYGPGRVWSRFTGGTCTQ
ncbi:MAG TPA: hypothetical protein VFJ66_07875 [Gaiellales bacterium]|nr:hypothetical protein [Gaiellales bacterium]